MKVYTQWHSPTCPITPTPTPSLSHPSAYTRPPTHQYTHTYLNDN